MEVTITNVLFALCCVLAINDPTTDAYPMTSYEYNQYAFNQQSSALTNVTDAIAVSYRSIISDSALYSAIVELLTF